MITHRIARGWERARTTPGLGRDLTAIVLLVIAGVVVASGILANQRVHWPWENDRTVLADFTAAPGISPGNGQEVRIAGVTVGRIAKADVTDDGHAQLTLEIDPKYQVYKDAILTLRPKTPLNDMYVEMNPGSPAAGQLGEADVLPVAQTRTPVQIDQVLGHLDDRTRSALTSLLDESDTALVTAPSDLPPGLTAADHLLQTFRPVVRSLARRQADISSLVTALRSITSAAGGDDQRLRRLVQSLSTTVTTLAGHDGDIRAALAQLPGTTRQLKNATGHVRGLSNQLDPTLRNLDAASTELPTALSKVGDLAGRLDTTAVKARPVVAQLRPVVADLRPFTTALQPTLADLVPVTNRLGGASGLLVSRLTDLQAFVYNTTSIVSLQDANGGILRGQIDVNASTLGLPMGGSH
ncbi:MAG TPA: MlaD family protein [Nocardioides sp.]|nr:MlaD family protein [Nocardioides sp.]